MGLQFKDPLPRGNATVKIRWTGKLSATDNEGAYRQEENGDWYVLTQGEPLGMRRVFPSFDEPLFKIPWRISLRVPKADAAYFNTPVESTEDAGEMKLVRFAETKPLPSYLLAFGVGPFERVDAGKVQSGAPVGIVVTRGKKAWAAYSAQSSPRIMDILEDWFQIPYHYPKLDLIEVPLGGGAMENPGLITFAQRINLAKPGEDTPQFHRRAADVEAHEFSHLWFGDMVTTEWWDDLWLNEAFATWMTFHAIEKFAPSWNTPAERADSMLAGDERRPLALGASHPPAHPERGGHQDGLRRHHLPEGRRRHPDVRGVRRRGRLPPRRAVVPEGVRRRRRHRAAFPRLHLRRRRQGRFQAVLHLPRSGRPAAPDREAVLRGGQGQPCALAVALRAAGRVADAAACADLADPGLRAHRPGPRLHAAHGEVRDAGSGRLPALGDAQRRSIRLLPDRAGRRAAGEADAEHRHAHLAGEDALLLRRLRRLAGRGVEFPRAFELARLLSADKDRHVVQGLFPAVEYPDSRGFLSQELRPKYASWVRDTFGRRARALGFAERKGEGDDARILRPPLLELVGDQGEDPSLRAQARKVADRWLADHRSTSPELASAALFLSAIGGDAAFYEKLHAAAKKESVRVERQRILQAMGEFRDPQLVQQGFRIALGDEFDPRESILLMWGPASDPRTREAALQFVEENFDKIVQRMPRDYGAGLVNVGSGFCDDAHATALDRFFRPRSRMYPGGDRRFAQALEQVRQCAAFRAKAEPALTAWLEKGAPQAELRSR